MEPYRSLVGGVWGGGRVPRGSCVAGDVVWCLDGGGGGDAGEA